MCSVVSDWDHTDCSLPGSSVHGIFQARIPEWVAVSSSRDLPNLGNRIGVSCVSFIGKWILNPEPSEKPSKSESHAVLSDSLRSHGLYSPEFSRPEYGSGYPIPSAADLPEWGIEPGPAALQVDSLPTELSGKPFLMVEVTKYYSLREDMPACPRWLNS